jgi:hypothetical protein
MTVNLNGQTYDTVRDMEDQRIVIVLRGAMWREADPAMSRKILAGLTAPPLRVEPTK